MPVAHNKVRILGLLPGGEVWSVNPSFYANLDNVVTDYDELLAWATAIAALNEGDVFPAGLRSLLSSAASISSIRTEYRDGNGNLSQAAEYTLPIVAAGTGTASKPFQTAVVSSLLTGRPGRSRRGRLYWPALAANISSTSLRLSTPSASAVGEAVRSFLSAVTASAPAGKNPQLAVISETLSTATQVTQVAVGDVLDVQRRRRDSLVEQIATVNYPTA